MNALAPGSIGSPPPPKGNAVDTSTASTTGGSIPVRVILFIVHRFNSPASACLALSPPSPRLRAALPNLRLRPSIQKWQVVSHPHQAELQHPDGGEVNQSVVLEPGRHVRSSTPVSFSCRARRRPTSPSPASQEQHDVHMSLGDARQGLRRAVVTVASRERG